MGFKVSQHPELPFGGLQLPALPNCCSIKGFNPSAAQGFVAQSVSVFGDISSRLCLWGRSRAIAEPRGVFS